MSVLQSPSLGTQLQMAQGLPEQTSLPESKQKIFWKLASSQEKKIPLFLLIPVLW